MLKKCHLYCPFNHLLKIAQNLAIFLKMPGHPDDAGVNWLWRGMADDAGVFRADKEGFPTW